MEQWVMVALGVWVLWAEVRVLAAERRHAAERRELCARLQAGTIERYDAHVARSASAKAAAELREERPRTPAAPTVMAPGAESVADAKLQFDRLMSTTADLRGEAA